jgi:HAD superfamily hydrolase (TIGR01509 family)
VVSGLESVDQLVRYPPGMPDLPYDAVCFDFNGTISLDEELSQEAWAETFHKLGVPWTRERFYSDLVGHSSVMIAHQGYRLARDEDPSRAWVEQAIAARHELDRRHLEAGHTVAEETADVVRQVARRLPVALVTSAPRALVDSEAGAAGLLPSFTAVVAHEDVRAHKPDPECYQKAVALLDLASPEPIARPLAVEDSRPGILAARAAGLDVVIVGEWAPDDLDAVARVDSLTDPRFLEILGLAPAVA